MTIGPEPMMSTLEGLVTRSRVPALRRTRALTRPSAAPRQRALTLIGQDADAAETVRDEAREDEHDTDADRERRRDGNRRRR